MTFGGPGGPVFPTQKEQAWIDEANKRIDAMHWPKRKSDAAHVKLSFSGLGIAIGCMLGICLTICAIGWLFL